MRHLIIVAHGSRRMASNDEVRAVTEKLARQNHDFDKVSSAFLEIVEPSIPQSLLSSIEEGATEIVVLPYFLSAGRHVSEDVPSEIAVVQIENPNIAIKIAPYLGKSDSIAKVLLEQTRNIN